MLSVMMNAQGLRGSVSWLAQATAPAAHNVPWYLDIVQKGGLFVPLAVVLLLYVFLASNSKRKDEKKRQNLIDQVKRGARVQTIGGIIGKVVEAETDRVLLKVDESSNTKIWFARSAIHRVVDEEKQETK